jgi:hypothetical protein
MNSVFQMKTICAAALATAAALFGTPDRADAAAYFTETAWESALSAVDAETRGPIVLNPLNHYTVTYADWYGSWDQNTKYDPFTPGPEIGPYVTPGSTISRSGVYFAQEATPGQFAANYSCLAYYNACVGVMSVTFDLPYAVLGFSGMLDLRADYWPIGMMSELEVDSIVRGTDWMMNNPDTFYGKLFDQPTDTFTVSWGIGGYGSDNFAAFTLNDVTLVRAPAAVPEPASIALFGIGLVGVIAARRKIQRPKSVC